MTNQKNYQNQKLTFKCYNLTEIIINNIYIQIKVHFICCSYCLEEQYSVKYARLNWPTFKKRSIVYELLLYNFRVLN